MWNNELFTAPYTKTFSEVYSSFESFSADYNTFNLKSVPFKNTDFLKTIYTILMGEYASSAIMNMSEPQFRIRLFTKIMAHGPQYERELDIQSKLLSMDDSEIQISAKAIYNTSLNPSMRPTTQTLEELKTINQQSVTNHVRSKLDAWDYLGQLLDDDITKRFVKKFNELFVVVLKTNNPLWFKTREEDETYD